MERILKSIQGYVVIANINSPVQCVIGGETAAVDAAIRAFLAAGLQATKIAVSHAFHTRIVAPASQPLRKVIARMNIQAPNPPRANPAKPFNTMRRRCVSILIPPRRTTI